MLLKLNVSRAENKLVVRKCYLKDSNACTSDTYSTYPESRKRRNIAKIILDSKVPRRYVNIFRESCNVDNRKERNVFFWNCTPLPM